MSSMLQSYVHPKLSTEQFGDYGDSNIELENLSHTEQEDKDVYDQLLPLHLEASQLAQLSNQLRKGYFEEYDYCVRLSQKKQPSEELKKKITMKSKGKDSAALVSVPLQDLSLPL